MIGGQAGINVAGELDEFGLQLFESARKNPNFVEKSGTFPEKNLVKDCIPGSGALCRVAAEEFRFQRLDSREVADMAAAIGKGVAERNEHFRKARKKIRNH